jgi:hypothetical protein
MTTCAAGLVAEARPSSQRLTVEQTAAALARGEAVLVDLRAQ